MEFPGTDQETGKRPTAALGPNLAYLGLVDLLSATPSTAWCSTTGRARPPPPA